MDHRGEYDHVPSGSLELHLKHGTSYSATKIIDTKKARLEERLNELVIQMLRDIDHRRFCRERARLEAIAKEQRRQRAVELEITRRTESVREDRLLKTVPLWQKAERIKEYVAAVREEAQRRAGQIDAESELGRWLRWAEQYVESVAPLAVGHYLPTFSLTSQELEVLKRECEADWQPYSETFRPRQPR